MRKKGKEEDGRFWWLRMWMRVGWEMRMGWKGKEGKRFFEER